MGNLDSLPEEIILEILKRVDIDSVIQYRLVSRSWNYLVYHLLLDHLKETQMEFQRKAKEIDLKWGLSGRLDEIKPQVDRILFLMSICFSTFEELMGNLDSLPEEIILEILKRVDIDSVIQYRLVSRSWNYLAYHLLLDHLKETQMEFQRQAKEIEIKWGLTGRVDEIKPQLDPTVSIMSICFSTFKEIMEFIKDIMELINELQAIVDAQKISGGPDALLEFRKLLVLTNFTDTDLKRYLICLHRKERVDCLELVDCADCITEWLRIRERTKYLFNKLRKPQNTYLASGIRVLRQAWRLIVSAGPFEILFIFLFLCFILLVIAITT